MGSPPNTLAFRNRILAGLAPRDLELVRASLSPISLPVRKPLQKVGAVVTDVYFVEDGIVSVVATSGSRGKPVEVGLIGSEGVTGIEIILASNRSRQEVYPQVAGSGYRMRAADLVAAMNRSQSLRETLLRFAGSFLAQVTETALANGSATIDVRLSRWLLMADDRLESDALPLTHEFLALMLGVRRAGVTLAIQDLARIGLIDNRRGRVTIIDRKRLASRAAGIYQPLPRDAAA